MRALPGFSGQGIIPQRTVKSKNQTNFFSPAGFRAKTAGKRENKNMPEIAEQNEETDKINGDDKPRKTENSHGHCQGNPIEKSNLEALKNEDVRLEDRPIDAKTIFVMGVGEVPVYAQEDPDTCKIRIGLAPIDFKEGRVYEGRTNYTVEPLFTMTSARYEELKKKSDEASRKSVRGVTKENTNRAGRLKKIKDSLFG